MTSVNTNAYVFGIVNKDQTPVIQGLPRIDNDDPITNVFITYRSQLGFESAYKEAKKHFEQNTHDILNDDNKIELLYLIRLNSVKDVIDNLHVLSGCLTSDYGTCTGFVLDLEADLSAINIDDIINNREEYNFCELCLNNKFLTDSEDVLGDELSTIDTLLVDNDYDWNAKSSEFFNKTILDSLKDFVIKDHYIMIYYSTIGMHTKFLDYRWDRLPSGELIYNKLIELSKEAKCEDLAEYSHSLVRLRKKMKKNK